jgi:hypothetical protein
MASGTRVIGGNRDGSVDPLGDGALGTAIDPRDMEQLVTAICAALRDAPAKIDSAGRFRGQAFREHLQMLVSSNFVARP